jgi:hypothetical protein
MVILLGDRGRRRHREGLGDGGLEGLRKGAQVLDETVQGVEAFGVPRSVAVERLEDASWR